MYDAETRARALGLLPEGLSQNAVSKQLGINRAAIRDWTRDHRGAAGGMRNVARSGRAYSLRIFCDATQDRVIWKHWPCLFPQHGPGRKRERALGMADWQWRIVEAHPADFLRDLFHSDGCRVNNWATRMVAGERKR